MNRPRQFCLLCALAAIGAILSCSTNDRQGSSSSTSPASTASDQVVVRVGAKDTPSDAECEAFARNYQAAVTEGDISAVNNSFDWESMFQTVTDNVDVSQNERDQFIAGLRQGIVSAGIGRQLVETVNNGGGVSFLRVHDVDGSKRALFRVLNSNMGVNYHDMILARDADGRVRAVDMYVFVSGETLSTTFRRIFLMAVANGRPTLIDKLVGSEREFVTNMKAFEKMTQQIKQGQFAEALETYETLPESLQQEKMAMILRIQAALQIDDPTYAKALEDFRKAHPKDAAMDLISIDHYLMRKESDAAMAAVDRVDQAVGGDPYLDVLRAGVLVGDNEFAKARELCEAALVQSPDLIELYWTLVNITMQEKRFAETAKWLTEIKTHFEVELADLTALPEYAEFVQSPEYQQWADDQQNQDK